MGHAQKVIHRDIKSGNLLLAKDSGILKLCDFGAAKEVVQFATQSVAPESNTGIAGTPNWMAPEVIKQSMHGSAADVWSVGCVLVELSSGRPPFYECDTAWAAMFQIAEGQLPATPAHMSPHAKDFLSLCLQYKPEARATAEALKAHSFLQQM